MGRKQAKKGRDIKVWKWGDSANGILKYLYILSILKLYLVSLSVVTEITAVQVCDAREKSSGVDRLLLP